MQRDKSVKMSLQQKRTKLFFSTKSLPLEVFSYLKYTKSNSREDVGKITDDFTDDFIKDRFIKIGITNKPKLEEFLTRELEINPNAEVSELGIVFDKSLKHRSPKYKFIV
jgi:hypothetical protein